MDDALRAHRRRPGGRSARVRAAVLEATLAELVESGYGGLTFDAVARRAGVHKTTLYRQWRHCEALVTEAILHLGDRQLDVPATGDLRSDLVALATAIAGQITQPSVAALIRTLVADGPRLPAFREVAEAYWSRRFELAGITVRRGIERGELPPGTDVKLLLEGLIGPLYLRLLVTGEEMSQSFVAGTVDQLLDGVRGRGWGGRRASSSEEGSAR
jgi:AcrR family transcriptional regulator